MLPVKNRYGILESYSKLSLKDRFSALSTLAESDDVMTFRMIINRYGPDGLLSNDNSLLHVSAGYGAFNISNYILSNKLIDVNHRDSLKRTPLHLAIIAASNKVVDLLIMYGVNVNALSSDGMTARSLAKSSRQFEILDKIKSKNPKR